MAPLAPRANHVTFYRFRHVVGPGHLIARRSFWRKEPDFHFLIGSWPGARQTVFMHRENFSVRASKKVA
jgi:hypothetical protein